MSWLAKFHAIFGTGLFGGATCGDWLQTLRENSFRVSPRYIPRLFTISGISLSNSISRRIERWKFGREVSRTNVTAPLFILGHWRSGTTHLHNLLSRDRRFAFPNLYQVLCPHTFLTTETIGSKLLEAMTPETRFGIDNVELGAGVPYEDEFAIAAMNSLSPYVSLAFPRNRLYYDRFLTLRDATPVEVARWKSALLEFLQKLTVKYNRRLVLKSPTHTCRIKLLLELFPDARFVHIRRHPFDVYRSMKKMLESALRFWQLQDARCIDWSERTITQYREMYEAYFAERSLIPAGRLHELSFEDLDADPIAQVREIYRALDLPSFADFEPELTRYVESLQGYQKNPSACLPPEVRDRLAKEWRLCFEEWGYSVD